MAATSDSDWSINTIRKCDNQVNKDGRALDDRLNDQVEEPRKFRVRKRHWQPDEDTLGEVLQQEIMAWRDTPLDQSTVRRRLRSPTGSINKKDRFAPSHIHIEAPVPTQGSSSDVSPLDELVSSYDHSSKAFPIKKSNFVEGSMNQASRGIASVWTDALSLPSISSRPTSTFSELESEPSTPRNAPSSRMSISSSIDINEFKPLPPTPTTFKATMKRFGSKFKSNDTELYQQKPNVVPKTLKGSRKGLRKSFSTWKFFDSAASEADDETVPDMPKTEYKTIRNAASTKTLKLLGRHKQQPQVDSSVALLEERKRKAEIAYAEQFGTSKKRYKPDPNIVTKTESTEDEFEPVTVRRRPSGGKVLGQNDVPANRDSFIVNTETLPPSLDCLTSTLSQRVSHRRNSSRDSTSSRGSNRDRLKRVSRSELEKENQHLRELLRQRDRRTRSPTLDNEDFTRGIVRKGSEPGSRDSSPAEENMRAALSSHPVSESDTLLNIQQASSSENENKSVSPAEDLPPVPPLPPSLTNRSALEPVMNRPGRTSDTATVKRKGPVTTLGRTIELPRPLSMVLEGLEDDQEEAGDDAHMMTTRERDTTKTEKSSVKGSDLPGLKDCKENWDWPEDIF